MLFTLNWNFIDMNLLHRMNIICSNRIAMKMVLPLNQISSVFVQIEAKHIECSTLVIYPKRLINEYRVDF